MKPEIVEWKYFDRKFNQGRERGHVWLHNDRIAGFIGTIPFSLGRAEQSRDCSWLCDWSLADPQASPGMGVLLLRRAVEACGRLAASFGGNDMSRRFLPRVAARTVEDAGVTFVRPLRLGAVLEAVRRKLALPRLAWPAAPSRIPLFRGSATPRRRVETVIEPGVPGIIAPLLAAPRGPDWHPRYGIDHVDWQIGRCPALASWTCYTRDLRAAATFWRPRASTDHWRVALWAERDCQGQIASVLGRVVSQAGKEGGVDVSLVASRLDAESIRLLRRHFFFPLRKRRPLFVFGEGLLDGDVGELRNLSYLDTDLAYRF